MKKTFITPTKYEKGPQNFVSLFSSSGLRFWISLDIFSNLWPRKALSSLSEQSYISFSRYFFSLWRSSRWITRNFLKRCGEISYNYNKFLDPYTWLDHQLFYDVFCYRKTWIDKKYFSEIILSGKLAEISKDWLP